MRGPAARWGNETLNRPGLVTEKDAK